MPVFFAIQIVSSLRAVFSVICRKSSIDRGDRGDRAVGLPAAPPFAA
jgi:hypothetical protein